MKIAVTQKVMAISFSIPYKTSYNIVCELRHIQNRWYYKESSLKDAVSFMVIRLIG